MYFDGFTLVLISGFILGSLGLILRGLFSALREGARRAEEHLSDAERRQNGYRSFRASFSGRGIPERVIRELYALLWQDVLWAVKMEVAAETCVDSVYLPNWVDVGKTQALACELSRRCGNGLELNPMEERFTLGDLAIAVASAMKTKTHVPDRLLVRASRSPMETDLLRPARAGAESPTGLLLRVPGEGNETFKQ